MVLEDAQDSYSADIVHQLPSNAVEDVDSNVARIVAWVQQWNKDNRRGASGGGSSGAGRDGGSAAAATDGSKT